MNFQGNFRKVGTVDVGALTEFVDTLTEADWERESVRHKRYEVHKDTQFIGIVYDEDFRHQRGTRQPILEQAFPVLKPVFQTIAEYYESAIDIRLKFQQPVEGYFIRVSLAKLKAGGEIPEHQDGNFSLTHSHRVHLPLVTNEDVKFTVGYETRHLSAGDIIEINNRRLHSVKNGGAEDRVHLILDWVFPWEPCCCSDKTHPEAPCTPDNCLMTDRFRIPCNCHPEDPETDKAFLKSVDALTG